MAESHDLGKKGEEIAAGYLKKKGYRIVRRNWRSGKTEIDIIAETNEVIVFIEVKTRSAGFMEDPKSAINREKQRVLVFAADNFIKWNRIDKESRFDVVTVIMNDDEPEIDHIEAAFYPSLR